MRCLSKITDTQGNEFNLMQINDFSVITSTIKGYTSPTTTNIWQAGSHTPPSWMSAQGDLLCKVNTSTVAQLQENKMVDNDYLLFKYGRVIQGSDNFYGMGFYNNKNSAVRLDTFGDGPSIGNQTVDCYLGIVLDDDNQRAYILACTDKYNDPSNNKFRIWALAGKYNGTDLYWETFGEVILNQSAGGAGLYGGYKGGAGSGYIGNSLLSNKKMVGYNVPTSSAEGTKTESVNEVSASAVSDKPKSGNGHARIKIIEDFDNDSIYGFVEDMSITNPAQRITYICKNKNYTPLTINLNGNHLVNYNSWSEFPVLTKNVPCMVKSDGRADYKLNETTYSQKLGGGNSDVSNTSYNGAGAFSWINKIYSRFKIYGNKKVVMFSTIPKTGFEAIGFKTNANTELEGIWLPMFYGVDCSGTYKSIAGQWAASEKLFSEDKTGIENNGNRARFFGGSIISVINELLTMFSKSPDMLACYGYGQSDAWRYAPYGDQHHGMAANTIIDGGQFYGDLAGRYCNKILHSMMLGTHSFMLKDPYVNIKNGKVSVSRYYNIDIDGIGYDETSIDYGNKGLSSNWHIPLGYKVVNNFGFFLDYSRDGYSTSDGTCSGIAINTSVSNGIIARYGAGMDAININGYYLCDARGSFLDDTRGFWYNSTPMMLPPVGYKPN